MIRTVLITNLHNVNVGPIRTYSYALLLQDRGEKAGDNPLSGEPRYRARGFGVVAGEPTFDMELPSIEYAFAEDEPPPWIKSMGGTVLTMHGVLTIRGGPRGGGGADLDDVELRLDVASTNRQPVDIEHHEWDARDRTGFERLWKRLEGKVAHYHEAPLIRTIQMVRTELVQRACPVEVRR